MNNQQLRVLLSHYADELERVSQQLEEDLPDNLSKKYTNLFNKPVKKYPILDSLNMFRERLQEDIEILTKENT